MLQLPVGLALLLFQPLTIQARTQYAPEDTYAFPKYHINFLNNHPITSRHAQILLDGGMLDGLQDFMGNYRSQYEGDWPTLDGPENAPSPQLQRMRLGGERSFLCLTPPPLTFTPPAPEEPAPVDPAKSWALLQPLTGTCLYQKQGWFTYAYCHNKHVRQFKELEHTHPHPAGGRIPKEDPDYHAYTLGKSTEAAVAVQGEGNHTGLQLSEGAGKRFLTSKWTDGTPCDKTGRGREIEIQFHCSMTTTDSIQFLKETSVCLYLMVIHTPRLCGEPGFQSLREKQPAAPIHCREIISEEAGWNAPRDEMADFQFYPEGAQPQNSRTRSASHIPNIADQRAKQAKADKARTLGVLPPKGTVPDIVHKAIDALLKKKERAKAGGDAVGPEEEGGDMFEFVLPLENGEEEDVFVQVLDFEAAMEDKEALADALRTALGDKLGKAMMPGARSQEEWDDEKEEEVYLDDSL